MKFIQLLVLALISTSVFAKMAPLRTVEYVNLDKYVGTWYEIARFDQKFQRNCTAVKATYTKLNNGEIKVFNECNLYSPEGKYKSSIGRAWVNDKKTNAKLKVQFFLRWWRLNLFSGNYWVIELDEENYTYAVIGDPSRKYLWILSRTSTMDESLYQELVARARAQGFNTEHLLRTIH